MFKKFIYLLVLIAISGISYGQTKVVAPVVPNSPLDVYPTHIAIFGKGGMKNVLSITERNAIPTERRENGMFVYTYTDSTLWVLDSVGTPAPYWKPLIIGTAIPCPPNFSNIEGDALTNQSLLDALSTKQNTIPLQSLLEYRKMYMDGNLRPQSLVDDVREVLRVKVDSTSKDFQFFSDTSNLLLSKGAIPNTDSAVQTAGMYWYTNATRGFKPSPGSGILMVYVQQATKTTTGAGRVEQVFHDYNLNRIVVRSANSGVWSTPDTLASFSDLRGGTATYLPITGGALTGNNAFIGLAQRIPAIVFPTNNNIQIGNTNGHRFYMADSTGMVNSGVGRTMMFDFSLVDPGATRNVKWPNITGGEMTTLGNVVNSGNGLVQLTGGALPAVDGSLLTGVYPSVGGPLATGGYIGLIRKGGNPTAPTDSTINIYSNSVGKFTMQSKWGQLQFDFSSLTTNRAVIWDDIAGGHVTVLGNTVNTAGNLVQLDGSGKVPAASVNIAAISATGTASGTTYLRGDGTWSTPSGGSGNVIGTTFIGRYNSGAGSVNASTSTYGVIAGSEATGVIAVKGTLMGTAGTFSNAWFLTSSAQGAGGALTATLLKNGSATAIVITVPAGSAAGSFSDVTHTVTIAAGDKVEWQFTNADAATSATFVNTSIDFKQ